MANRRGIAQGTLLLILVAAFVLTAAVYVAKPGEDVIIPFGDSVYVIYAVVAALFGYAAMRVYGTSTPQGKLLLLLTLMAVTDAIAGAIWAYYEIVLGILSPFPSIADLFWLVFYVFGIGAMLYMITRIWRSVSEWKVVLTAVLAVAVAVIVYFLMLQPIFGDPEETLLLKLTSALYPVGDLILVSLVFLAFLCLRGNIFGAAWRNLLIALIIYSVSDLVSTYQIYAGTYQTGNLIDLGWYAGQLLLAYAFFEQGAALKAPQRRGGA